MIDYTLVAFKGKSYSAGCWIYNHITGTVDYLRGKT